MFSILDLFSLKQATYQFDPKKCLYRLGNNCKLCKKRISYAQSITVCDCPMFTHEKCFIQQFQQLKECDQRSKIQCIQCQNQIKIQYCSYLNFRPKCSIKCLLLLTIVLILASIFFVLIFQTGVVARQEINSMMLTIQILGVVMLLGLAFLIIISSLFQKQKSILGLQKSKKKIVISAFDHIITEPEEDTQNCFVLIQKHNNQQETK